MINPYHQKLFDVLDEFLDQCDDHFDSGDQIDLGYHYRRINRAMDAIYREVIGAPQPIKTGRPRKNKEIK